MMHLQKYRHHAALPHLAIVASLSPSANDLFPSTDLVLRRSRRLRIGSLAGGYNIAAVLSANVSLPKRLAQSRRDLIIVGAESQARDALAQVATATCAAHRPIALLTEDK